MAYKSPTELIREADAAIEQAEESQSPYDMIQAMKAIMVAVKKASNDASTSTGAGIWR